MNKSIFSIQLIFSIAGGLFLLFLVAPLLNLLLVSSPQHLLETAMEPSVRQSIGLSLGMAAVATVLCALLVIPFSWLMARKQWKIKPLISGLIDLPMMIPHSAAGIALLGVISRDSLVGRLASNAGIDFVDRPAGIALAMAFVSVPYLFNAAHNAFASVPLRLELASLNLGANSWSTFFKISLPLAWRGILNGLVMMFARGMSEFGAVVIIAYNPFTTPVLIFDRFNAFGLSSAQSISALFIFICLIVFIGLRLLTKTTEDARY